MPRHLDPESFLSLSQSTPMIDVRSPSEFESGRVQSAVNIPLFNDEERAEIGTLYTQQSREQAILRGLEITGPKMADFVRSTIKLCEERSAETDPGTKPTFDVAVHCWRGGMRSNSFAWLLEQAGLEVAVLEGGYKAYRQHVHHVLDGSFRFQVISGLTGAAKTVYLHRLHDRGEQTIDLEGLANHRGSAFGGVGLGEQPTTEQFENSLFDRVRELDVSKPIWIEDEGNRIGRVNVPETFHRQIQHAPAIFIDASIERRTQHLVDIYGDHSRDELAYSIEKIRKRLGGQHVNAAVAALESGDLHTTTEIVLRYYDKTYLRAVDRMPRTHTIPLVVNDLDEATIVDRMISMGSQLHATAESSK